MVSSRTHIALNMNPQIATTISLLSSLALALSSVINADPVRECLEAAVNQFSNRVLWSDVVVAAGVALEGPETFCTVRLLWRRHRQEKTVGAILKKLSDISSVDPEIKFSKPDDDEPTWAKVCAGIGLIFVVLGLVGEWRYTAKLEYANGNVHKYDVGKIFEADKHAGDAKTSAETARSEADKAKVDAESAEQKAQKARDLAIDAIDKYSNAESKLESERRTRVDLEKSLAPRVIRLNSEKVKAEIDSLRRFARVNVIFELLPDAEAQRAAGNIAALLRAAGFTNISVRINPSMSLSPFDGVLIFRRKFFGPGADVMEDKDGSKPASDALLDVLRSNDWEADTRDIKPDRYKELAPSTMQIAIGLKPYPYFFPPETKEEILERDKAEQWGRDFEEKMRKEIDRIMKQNSPTGPTTPP